MNIGFINGEYINADEAVIPIDERGHQFGDGVYEVVKIYNSLPFLLDEHLTRLKESASAIQLKLPYSLDDIKKIILEGIKRSELLNAEVYFQVTRGIAPRNHLFPNVSASFTMTIKPARKVSEQSYYKGIKTITTKDERWANCHIKSLNLLPNVLAKQKANNEESYEAILIKDGYVTEGSSTNVFVVKNNTLYTTPLTNNILSGITRKNVLKLAQKLDVEVLEKSFTTEFLISGDEAFLTSTTVEVLPIRSVNNKVILNGDPGPITKLLHESFRQLYAE
ncbi:D-amino-acid transaminase [Virgibacillus byunsanensis]|uniref:D-alanine aminotransferase n=1 Tax=Virgibacillus byunsanensis TaxID=570945 RepID=A0ABW3LKF3_9BACI